MKRTLYYLFCFSIFFAAYGYSQNCYAENTDSSADINDKAEKTIIQLAKVNSDAILEIENKFGNIFITEGSSNEISFSITITGKAETVKKAQEIVDNIKVEFSFSPSKVTATTVFNIKNQNNSNTGMEINYNVTVPSSVFLQLNNQFGNIYLKDCKKELKASAKFGNIEIDALKADKNQIELKFGNLKLKQGYALNLDMAHSTAEIGNITQLILSSSHSSINIESAGLFSANNFSHGNISITSINEIQVSDLSFSNISLKHLMKKVDINNLKMSTLDVENIENSFSGINIGASFSNITLNLSKNTSCKVDLYMSMGDIKIASGFKQYLQKEDADRNGLKKICSGIIGKKSSPDSHIKISNSHADIILNEIK